MCSKRHPNSGKDRKHFGRKLGLLEFQVLRMVTNKITATIKLGSGFDRVF